MRPPLGMPLEEHKPFALALTEIDYLADRDSRLDKLNGKLRYELDEHVFSELTDLREQARLDIYYTASWCGFNPDECSLDHVLAVVPQLVERLAAALPDSPVHQMALDLQKELGKSSVQRKLRANQERRTR